MNKAELVEQIVVKAGVTKADAGRALSALLEAVAEALQGDNPVVLAGFGTFVARRRPAREGRNPQTGEKIKIKAAKVVGFKASKALKEAVRGEDTNR
jgi:DNA-binding protein HU-beta